MTTNQAPIADYRHATTRKNNPPAALAAQGRVREVPKQRYYYDPHMSPALRFDESAKSDDLMELLQQATQRKLTTEEAQSLADAMRNREPWLEWSGKREQKYFEVDPVALHIHERVSAQAAMRIAARQDVERTFWADPEQEYREAVQFYQHDVEWANRLILGDSLLVMNSLAKREDMAGKVQMIYVDPPYGIRFRSNFQPFVHDRNVTERESDLTREPEMVKAYRDTWTLGIHTYLAYLRDRLVVARDLLTESGSIFVQIGDENVHRVRAIMDEVFGSHNFVSLITYRTSSGTTQQNSVKRISDYIIWYSKEKENINFNRLLEDKIVDTSMYNQIELYDGFRRPMTTEERKNPSLAPKNSRPYQKLPMHSMASGDNAQRKIFDTFWRIPPMRSWRYAPEGGDRLVGAARIHPDKTVLRTVYYHDDFPVYEITNSWEDTGPEINKNFVVQTSTEAIQRCILMTTNPGDLVLDPTCGSGTTAYVAEQWGRRWITIDTSRVAIALARQRILTSKFNYYKTNSESDKLRADSFQYKTVPHITLGGIANNVALDPIFTKWEPVLDGKLAALNSALAKVNNDTRSVLLTKLETKRKKRPRRDYPITDADERRWQLPKDRWEHWQVPFDADPDYPTPLRHAVEDYRKTWRDKMDEVNACIAANAEQEVLVDQPEIERGIVRVSGPFTVEAVQPPEESIGQASPIGGAPHELDDTFDADEPTNAEAFLDSMIRMLRADGVRFQGNIVARFTRLEPLAEGSVLHADGEWESANDEGDSSDPSFVAVSVGPPHGPVTAKQVEDALWAASRRGYDALVFAGFSFDGAAQAAIQDDSNPRVRVHMAQISPDVTMGDLLKQTRDSQLFTVSGLPRTALERQPNGEYIVDMEGVDIYDPVRNTIESERADHVAAWFLDSDYDGRTFCISQAFFPNSKAWDRLKRALKRVVDEDAFTAFSGTRSLSFRAGQHLRAAVKVIDPRGNEVMRVHNLEAETNG